MYDVGHLECPIYDGDVFSADALRHPFEHYKRIRDLGPVVRLPGVDAYAMGRFADIQTALRSPAVLISGNGVGFSDAFNRPNEKNNAVIQSDGDRHRRLRMNITKPLMPAALKPHRDMLKGMITQRVRELKETASFDGVDRLAKHLPLAAISFLVGLPEDGRQNMLRWATATFNLVGPPAPHLGEDVEVLREFRAYLLSVDPADIREGSWAKSLFEAADAGKLTVADARAALSALTAPSLDTTINAKSSLLNNLARNPDQWRILKDNRSLIPGAVVEGVRHSATVRWFSRCAVADYRQGDVFIPDGARVMLIYGSANRDERHYPDPDRFLVERKPIDQLGWGTGPHMCGGMHLAKMELEVLLEALVENVDRLEAGEPVLSSNRGLYGFESLPLTIH